MNPIYIVIPTLDQRLGESTGKWALATSLVRGAELVVSVDPGGQGFTKTANQGMRKASVTGDICLLNDDISWFPLGWLARLQAVLYQHPRYGLTAPTGNSGTAPMNKGKPGMFGVQVVEQAPFWCVLLKRALLDDIGLLDESFIHYASDNWYCYQMRKRNWQCAWVKDVYLVHHKHGSGHQQSWRARDHQLYHKRRSSK